MNNKKTSGSLLLLITALVWGFAFVAQKIGTVNTGALTFSAARFYIAAIALFPLTFAGGFRDKVTSSSIPEKQTGRKKATLLGGALCGVFLALGTAAQQIGLEHTTAGKAGFITALYIVFIPVTRVFTRKTVSPSIWISVPAAVAGLYLLSVKEGLSVNAGDAFELICALFFTLHILSVSRFSPRADGVRMSFVQFISAAAVSTFLMLLFEKPDWTGLLSSWAPLLYLGAVSGTVGYTLQILGQRNTDPTVASLIMSLESVFAAIAGAIILGESFTAKELAGCALVFGATVMAQLNFRKRNKTQTESLKTDM